MTILESIRFMWRATNYWLRLPLVLLVLAFGFITFYLFAMNVSGKGEMISWVALLQPMTVALMFIFIPVLIFVFFIPAVHMRLQAFGNTVDAGTADIGTFARRVVGWILIFGATMALIARWVPWWADPGNVPWFFIGLAGFLGALLAGASRFRTFFVLVGVVLVVATCYQAGWHMKTANTVRGVATSLGFGGLSALDSVFAVKCKPTMGYALRIGTRQCVKITRVEGDRVNNLILHFERAQEGPGAAYLHDGVATLTCKNGFVHGEVLQSQGTVEDAWLFRVADARCPNGFQEIRSTITAERAPEPQWDGLHLTFTIARSN